MKMISKSRILSLIFALLFGFQAFAEKTNLERVEPPFWWAGMASTELQLMVYGQNISETTPVLTYNGVSIRQVIHVESPNYLFIDIEFDANVKPGHFSIQFMDDKKVKASYDYELKPRKKDACEFKGFDNSDVIYLLMPDRFSNGDPSNDNIPDMLEKADRNKPNGRHGGDIQGIIDHLDYFNDLGVTALWINPLLENNMETYSYHGYAMTDFYKVDPRFGSNADYAELVEKAHEKGLKIIMDMVFNHCGTGYYWKDDLPMKDWYNQWPEFTRSNYRGGVVTDPHQSEYDYNKMVKGWFDVTMADLNQENKLLANFIIQNSIWWIEYVGLDGIRQDTYPYPYQDFMSQWMERVLLEYPNYNVVGEVWLSYPQAVAYWMQNERNKDGKQSGLTNVFDFPLMYAISKAFNEDEGWASGTAQLYEVLSQDYVYEEPLDLVVFADNHDGDRLYTKLKEDINSFKMSMAYLLTTRGIPQLYYGTELLMTGEEHKGHGYIREDFPGGWPGDPMNAFTPEGRSEEQNEAFNFLQSLLQWRKTSQAVQFGKLTHFVPEEGVYVYFRHTDKEAVMILINNSEEEKTIDLDRFNERLAGYTSCTHVLSGNKIKLGKSIVVPEKSPMVLQLHP